MTGDELEDYLNNECVIIVPWYMICGLGSAIRRLEPKKFELLKRTRRE